MHERNGALLLLGVILLVFGLLATALWFMHEQGVTVASVIGNAL